MMTSIILMDSFNGYLYSWLKERQTIETYRSHITRGFINVKYGSLVGFFFFFYENVPWKIL